MPTEERVLCFRRQLLEELGVFQGLCLDVERYLSVVTSSAHILYLNRTEAEQDKRYKQLIPYVLIFCNDRILRYRRGKGGQMVRSAGTGAQLMARDGSYAQVRLPSGEVRKVHVDCYATVGQVGNIEHENISWGKAGRMRYKGFRPHNRGVVMNPVDHPMGGGEGKTSGGRHPVSPWGQPAKGYKTRRNKRTTNMIVRRRK